MTEKNKPEEQKEGLDAVVESAPVEKKEESKVKFSDFDIQIDEEEVEIPETTRVYKESKESKVKELMDKLKVKQSFFLPVKLMSPASAMSCKTKGQKELREQYKNEDLTFIIRTMKEGDEVIGVRIWRTV